MLIITVFFLFLFELRFKNYGSPNVTIQKYLISRKARDCVRCNYSVARSVNPAVVLTYAANASLDRSGDLRSGRTRNYSEKSSSMVPTRWDKEITFSSQRISIICEVRLYISAFFIRKRNQQHRSRRNYTKSALRTAAQGSQYTVDYAHDVN